jgi:hypothetical protein
MGKLLNLFKASVPAQRAPERRAQGDLADIEIVGESFHEATIRTVRKRYGSDEFEIVLRAETGNPYDPNAVAVDVDGAPVGHLSREMAMSWQPLVLAARSEGFAVTGVARVYGGSADKPNVGVFGAARWSGPGRAPRRPGR